MHRALALFAALAPLASARGATTLLQGESGSLAVGGYARMVGGLQELHFEAAPEVPADSVVNHLSLSSAVLRLEWKGTLGDLLSAQVDQRIFLRANSEALPLGGRFGLGTSVVPSRTVNLRTVAYDEDRLLLEHDIDRLALRASLGDFDVTLGRQAITWGISEVFPIADSWTNFSPFELDTTAKRGIDAFRLLYSQSRSLEVEAVVADRGTLKDLSAGLRFATYEPGADFYFALSKQWREFLVSTGVSAAVGAFKLRAEVVEPFDLDGSAFLLPRATAGASWVHPSLTLALEGHFNGTGVVSASEYASHLASSPAIQRGESYLLGRWYAGATATWKISELFHLGLNALCNVKDPSAVLAFALTYQVTQGSELSIGAYQGIGAGALIGLQTQMRSELGAVGGLYYLALASFF